MIKNFKLAAIVRQGAKRKLLRIPLHQTLQNTLATNWQSQYNTFVGGAEEVLFDAGYQPEGNECFYLPDYNPPEWLAKKSSQSAHLLDDISKNEDLLGAARGIAAFARNDGKEMVLFQNFNISHVIKPGLSLFLKGNTYVTTDSPGLTLDSKLSAVYKPADKKLLFYNFRNVNTFLPLEEHYEEASERDIRDVLNHKLLAPENVDALAKDASQWFRKRFAMLRDSDVLDTYTAAQIKTRSENYDINIRISDGKIFFPADKKAAKKLLQFLNEELFRGAITNQLYETNSKKKASS